MRLRHLISSALALAPGVIIIIDRSLSQASCAVDNLSIRARNFQCHNKDFAFSYFFMICTKLNKSFMGRKASCRI